MSVGILKHACFLNWSQLCDFPLASSDVAFHCHDNYHSLFPSCFVFVYNYIHLWEMILSPDPDLWPRFFNLFFNLDICTFWKIYFILFDVMSIINNKIVWGAIQDALKLFQLLLSQALSSICVQSCYCVFKYF